MRNEFHTNSSAVAIRLVKSLLIPVICYGLEYRVFKQNEINEINRIYIQSIKNIWSLKRQTPNWTCLSELNLYPIDVIVDARRLIFITTNVMYSEILRNTFFSNRYWGRELIRLQAKFDKKPVDEYENTKVSLMSRIKNLVNKKRDEVATNNMAKGTKFSKSAKNLKKLDSYAKIALKNQLLVPN